jgi:ribosomal protein S18 acetylase RimI-like enzyme
MSRPKLGVALSLFEQMAGFHPHEPHWYIPLFGVDPVFQGRGYGTQLMRLGLIACDRQQKPAYLEATSAANRTFYERHGFRVSRRDSIRRFATFVPDAARAPVAQSRASLLSLGDFGQPPIAATGRQAISATGQDAK